MKIPSLVLTLSLLASSSGFSAIFYSASFLYFDGSSSDVLITSATGIPLASGYAGTGVFSLTDEEVSALAAKNDFGSLLAAFNPIGGTDDFVTGTPLLIGVSAVPGVYWESRELDVTQYVGSTLYTLIGNSAAAGASTQYALLKFSDPVAADPSPPGLPNIYNLGASSATILGGEKGPTIPFSDLEASITNAQVGTIKLVTIPEPSAAVLGLLSLFGLARRRR